MSQTSLLRHHRRLFLQGLCVPVRIGIHEFEQVAPQRIVFDIELYVPLDNTTPAQDQIQEVVDYDFVREVVHARVARGHINLQETLGDDILGALLAHPGVAAASVSTHKPDVYPDCNAVGVQTFRAKPGVMWG
jgi:dihydroneopterin aldolase